MSCFLRVRIAVTVILAFAAARGSLADVPASIDETPQGNGATEYTVFNTSGSSAQPFDITLFAVATTGSDPTTTNSKWSAESVDATSWDQDMTGESLTWQQYTGLTYGQAFPLDPAQTNGYFLNYTLGPAGELIFVPLEQLGPGTNLSGFFFQGSPSSTFLVAGAPHGSTQFGVNQVITYSGTSTDVPEPAGIAGLAAVVVCFAGSRRVRQSYF